MGLDVGVGVVPGWIGLVGVAFHGIGEVGGAQFLEGGGIPFGVEVSAESDG